MKIKLLVSFFVLTCACSYSQVVGLKMNAGTGRSNLNSDHPKDTFVSASIYFDIPLDRNLSLSTGIGYFPYRLFNRPKVNSFTNNPDSIVYRYDLIETPFAFLYNVLPPKKKWNLNFYIGTSFYHQFNKHTVIYRPGADTIYNHYYTDLFAMGLLNMGVEAGTYIFNGKLKVDYGLQYKTSRHYGFSEYNNFSVSIKAGYVLGKKK